MGRGRRGADRLIRKPSQLWLFWLAPLVGAALGGLIGRLLYAPDGSTDTTIVETAA